MGISIIILCLLVQRFSSIQYGVYQLPAYLGNYYHWLAQKMQAGIILLILPLVIVVTLLFAAVYHFSGAVGYYLISAILFWIAVDCRGQNLLNKPSASIDELFIAVYNRFFAPIFWFVILGPAGLILYTAVAALLVYSTTQAEEKLVVHTMKLKGYLDWIPLRVVGFSFAVMGNFSVAFKNWLMSFRHPFALNEEMMAQYGLAALTYAGDELSLKTAIKLINRVILFWLAIIALFTLEFWLG